MPKEKSRIQIIIDEILSGGFTKAELEEIIVVCEEAIDNQG